MIIVPKYDDEGHILHDGERYTAIQELHRMLEERGIGHGWRELHDGYQITVPKGRPANWEGDAIQHFGSYGADRDLIEVWGFGLTDPEGYLTAEQAMAYFVEWDIQRRRHGAEAEAGGTDEGDPSLRSG